VGDLETTGVAGRSGPRGKAAPATDFADGALEAAPGGGGGAAAAQDRLEASWEQAVKKALSVRLLFARSAAQELDWRAAAAMVLPPSDLSAIAAQELDGRELAEFFIQPVANLTAEAHLVIGGWQGVVAVDDMVIAGPVESGREGAEMEALRTAYFCILPQVKKGIQTLSPVTRRFEQNVQQGT
jgi:hypothetical protein